ncbi:DNA-binding protein [Herbaspirillum hiltneri N3]|uniref:DNA-binding protein n=1 Tax=Herbaspirillum hiltneri N3 TaxID=1262470 RepID=A0ABN4HYU4_9BURK|nr:response regulator [Herbaspirillum hiltneri]AKZ63844.1 DNA-binding protein [Herbaspirillum hiltneri N3]
MNTTATAPLLQILVVDDSATSRVVIEKQLKKLGCDVATAQDGNSGLAAMQDGEFDLVLLDCQMPDMSGYDVAKIFRRREQEEELVHTPIIAISAETDTAHMQLCLDSGMDGVLGKPLPVDELKKMLSLWCDVDVSAAAPMNIDDLRSVDLRALFRTTSLEDFAVLQASATEADMASVGRLAHRMKGAALTMAAADIVATLERIEAIAMHRLSAPSDLAAEVSMLGRQLQSI